METQSTQSSPAIERAHQHPLPQRLTEVGRDVFLLGATLSIGAALMLRALGRQHDALFVGQWAPTLLLLGLYTQRHPEALRRAVSEMREQAPALH
jgi:hypothetical protein